MADDKTQFRVDLLDKAQHADPYPFITEADHYLAAVPDDVQIRAMTVGHLLKKGLIGVAVELIENCPASDPDAEELKKTVQQIRLLPRETRDWATTDRRFQANLDSLRSRGRADASLADELVAVWTQMAGDLTLHQANDGNTLVRGIVSGGPRLWIPAALDFCGKAEVPSEAEKQKNNVLPPILLDGVGIGHLVPQLHACTVGLFLNYKPAIFIVEENVRALALALRLHDWSEALRDERVYLFVGPDAWDQWRQCMCNEHLLPTPKGLMPLTRWPGQRKTPAEETLKTVIRHRLGLQADFLYQAQVMYEGRDIAYWAKRHASAGSDHPLRVLGLTCRYTTFLQHSTRDLLNAFERAGMQTRLMMEQLDHSWLAPHESLRAITEFKPDLIVVLDHHRREYPRRFIHNLPFVCWIQDDLPGLFNAQVGPELTEYDFTIGYGAKKCISKYGYPRDRFMPCRMAIDPGKFARRADGRDDPSLRCDAVYVSHHSETPEAFHARIRGLMTNPPTRKLVDAFYDEMRPLFVNPRFNGAYDLDALLRRSEEKAGLRRTETGGHDNIMTLYVRPLADRMLRHTTLEWVANWAESTGRAFHIYGRGWEEHPRLGRYARGIAEHGEHLAEICRQAAINLHTGVNTALHQRVLEILSAGGFVMARFHPFDFFEPAHNGLNRYIEENGIDRPTTVSLAELPADYVEARRRRRALIGEETPDHIEITEELLLENELGALEDERYQYANMAFAGFDRVTFDDAASFAERAEHFLNHPDERAELAEGMRTAVHELFTYDALSARIRHFLTERLTAMAEVGVQG